MSTTCAHFHLPICSMKITLFSCVMLTRIKARAAGDTTLTVNMDNVPSIQHFGGVGAKAAARLNAAVASHAQIICENKLAHKNTPLHCCTGCSVSSPFRKSDNSNRALHTEHGSGETPES